MASKPKNFMTNKPMLIGFSSYYFPSIAIAMLRSYQYYSGTFYYEFENLFLPFLSPIFSLFVAIFEPLSIVLYAFLAFSAIKLFKDKTIESATKYILLAVLLLIWSEFSLYRFSSIASAY